MNISMQSNNGITKVTMDGKTTIVNSTNVNIRNGKIYVDGNIYNDKKYEDKYRIENVTIEGNVEDVDTFSDMRIIGNVNGDISCNGNIYIEGDITGDVSCNGNITHLK